MTKCSAREYSPRVMNRSQHTGAFVVQFASDTDLAADQWVGRVEHVATSRGVQFRSLAELLGFIEGVLGDNHAEPESLEVGAC